MNLDELQSVQARERQSSDLQHLRSSFYREVGEYIQELTDERDDLVEDAEDPFSVPAVRQLTDDIETAEQTIEAIYERRVGKVVKKASIAAAGMPVGDEGLTAEETELFDDLVARIEENRETVLSVLGSGSSAGTYSLPDDRAGRSSAETEGTSDAAGEGDDETVPSATEGVSAADLMGGDSTDAPDESDEPGTEADDHSEQSADGDSSTSGSSSGGSSPDDTSTGDSSPDDSSTGESSAREVPPEPAPPGGSPDRSDDAGSGDSDASAGPADTDASAGPADTDGSPPQEASSPSDGQQDVPGIPRTTVRITSDVGEVVGADNRDYDLNREDVVSLPEPNAQVLVENDAAERLD